MASRKALKFEIGGVIINAKQGLTLAIEPVDANCGVCPDCRQIRRKKTPIADLTQYGFTWDLHKTVFACKCGCTFYHEYKIWHTGDNDNETAKRT